MIKNQKGIIDPLFVIALVLIVIAGGLLYWRINSSGIEDNNSVASNNLINTNEEEKLEDIELIESEDTINTDSQGELTENNDEIKLRVTYPIDGSSAGNLSEIWVTGSTAKQVDVKVNGNDVQWYEGNNFIVYIPLTTGDNEINIVAKDEDGSVATVKRTVTLVEQPDDILIALNVGSGENGKPNIWWTTLRLEQPGDYSGYKVFAGTKKNFKDKDAVFEKNLGDSYPPEYQPSSYENGEKYWKVCAWDNSKNKCVVYSNEVELRPY